jgi:hypothetical protein
MSTLTVSSLEAPVEGKREATIAFDSSYPTGGETIYAKDFALARFTRVAVVPTGATAGGAGYVYPVTISSDGTSANVLCFIAPGATPAGTISAPVFTGTSAGSLNLATPAFSGTGLTAAGQVITTTDNQTMTLNQCAGMWLISATGATPPNLILSNTAVTGAPAVLTVKGAASTDAGAYTIVKNIVPVGTNSAPTFTGTAISAGVLVEVGAATNLSALTAVPVVAYGY